VVLSPGFDQKRSLGEQRAHVLAIALMAVAVAILTPVVVPQHDIPLPGGAHVDMLLSPADVTPALKSTLD